jgi:hypothetical protein
MRRLLRKIFPKLFAKSSWDSRARAEIVALRVAIGAYFYDTGKLPGTLDDLCSDLGDNQKWDGPYISPRGEDTFLDPCGYRYQYRIDGEEFDLESRCILGYERDYG